MLAGRLPQWAQQVKNLPVVWEAPEAWIGFLGQEYPTEKEMATRSSTLAWRIPWTEEPTVHGITKEVRHG